MSEELSKYGSALPVSRSMFFNVALFEHMQRVANVFSRSTMVPEHFQNNIGNCLIAMNYADRIGADPFMVMQNMFVIHGKPGIEGKLVIGLVNQSGRFDPLEFEEGEEFCTAFAKELKSGKVLKGPKITMKMVKAEGWLDKKGSKWQTMPELMFRYRSATYFARTYCPEVLLGMQTKEEIEDVIDLARNTNGSYSAESKLNDLKERLSTAKDVQTQEPDPPEEEAEEVSLFEELKSARGKFKEYTLENLDKIREMTESEQNYLIAKWSKNVEDEAPLSALLNPPPEEVAGEPEHTPPWVRRKHFMDEMKDLHDKNEIIYYNCLGANGYTSVNDVPEDPAEENRILNIIKEEIPGA